MSQGRTRGELVKALGRVCLWLVVGLVFVRGVAQIAGLGEASAPAREPARQSAEFPGSDARAFAASFARAYMSFSPGHQEWVELALQPYLAPELRADAGIEVPPSGNAQRVESVTPARSVRIDREHALVTVAVAVSNKVVTTRYLSVPVARDESGGLVVYDYPSLAPPPRRARVREAVTESLTGEVRRPVEGVLERFFPAYFAGRTRDLDYFLPAGTSMRALGERYAFLELVSVEQERGERGSERTVLASVSVRDRESDAEYLLRYRVSLELRERWYVRAIGRA